MKEMTNEERISKLERKIDVIFDKVEDIRIIMKKLELDKIIENLRREKEMAEDNLKWTEQEKDRLWEERDRDTREFYQGHPSDCECVEIG